MGIMIQAKPVMTKIFLAVPCLRHATQQQTMQDSRIFTRLDGFGHFGQQGFRAAFAWNRYAQQLHGFKKIRRFLGVGRFVNAVQAGKNPSRPVALQQLRWPPTCILPPTGEHRSAPQDESP